jgi:uncharacterized protein (TIGR00369 family)
VFAVLADGPLGCALQSALPPAVPYTTAELSMNYLRPAGTFSERLTARGRLVHLGRSLALTEVFVEDARGRLLAHGTSRLAILPTLDVPPRDDLRPYPSPAFDTPDPYERSWPRTLVSKEAWERMSGLELMMRHITGDLPGPPIHHLTGLRPTEAGEGTVTFVLPATEWLCSPLASVEGGMTAMLADAALASAVQTTVPAATAYASVDLKVTFLRPVFPDGRDVTARAEVSNRGRRLATASAHVVNADGKAVASAVGSAMILPGRSTSLDRPVTPEEEEPRADE